MSQFTHYCWHHGFVRIDRAESKAYPDGGDVMECGCPFHSERISKIDPESHDFPVEKGQGYTCTCKECDAKFIGPKKSKKCMMCFIESMAKKHPDKYQQAVELEKSNGKTAAEMTFAYGDELDKMTNRFHDEWDVPLSIIIGCLTFKAHSLMNHLIKESEKDEE